MKHIGKLNIVRHIIRPNAGVAARAPSEPAPASATIISQKIETLQTIVNKYVPEQIIGCSRWYFELPSSTTTQKSKERQLILTPS